MSSNDASENSANKDERKAAADSLRRQIDKLKAGREPRSFNEFAEREAAEDQMKKKAED